MATNHSTGRLRSSSNHVVLTPPLRDVWNRAEIRGSLYPYHRNETLGVGGREKETEKGEGRSETTVVDRRFKSL